MIQYEQINKLLDSHLIDKVNSFLEEDNYASDYTSMYSIPPTTNIKAEIETEQDCVFCGKQIIEHIYEKSTLSVYVNDGDYIKKGTVIANVEGDAV